MARLTATEQARLRLQQLHDERRFRQTAVAKRLNMVPSNVSRTIHDADRPITLEFLEAVADEAMVPLAELVAPPGSLIKQLDADEATLLRYLRQWPTSIVRHLLGFLSFVANETPPETQTRNMAEYWRTMDRAEREFVYSVAILLKERALSPEMRAGLLDRLKVEQYTRASDDAKKRRTET